MAPVEPSFLSSNAAPLTKLATEVGIEIVLLSYIGSRIYKAHRNVSPAQHTRHQHKVHRRGIRVFLALAFTSLLFNIYFGTARRVLSYYQWAEHKGERVPGTLWGGRYESGKDVWLLDRWLHDTNISQERDLVILASSKAWWYAQQQLIGSLAFTAYLGIEGRRRNFGLLYTTAFAILSSQLGLSVAMNLLFVAILLSPEAASAPSRSHPDPRWAFGSISQLFSSIAPALLLFFTPHFPSALSVLYFERIFGSTLRTSFFLLAPRIVPKLLGHVHPSARAARRAYVPLFSSLAFLSLGMYFLQSFIAVSDSLPQTPRHWHFGHTRRTAEARSFFERAGHAVLRIINVPSAHPVIAEIVWDIFLTIITLCTWTAFRGLDLHDVARNSWLPWLRASQTSSTDSSKQKSASTGRSTLLNAAAETVTGIAKSTGSKLKPSVRQRRKPTVVNVEVPSDEEPDFTGKLDVRNIIAKADSPPASSTRRSLRGQLPPTKSQTPTDHDGSVLEDSDEEDDTDYVPTKATDRDVAQSVPGPEHGGEGYGLGEEAAAGEAVAVNWGLFILGGLGAVTSGVLGADV